MAIEWNLDPSADAEADAQKARLEAELARLGGGVTPARTESQDSPSTESQDSPTVTSESELDSLPPELVERVYVAQASHETRIQVVAEKLIALLTPVTDPDIRACAIGRALVVIADPDLVLVAHELERDSLPRKGDRVQEENGAIGTVVALKSLTEVVVKWDHEPRAMTSLVKYLTPIREGK